jgi:YHS domain-containing protein
MILIAGLLMLFYYLIRKAIREIQLNARLPNEQEGLKTRNQMVQDPVCRVFIPRETAIKDEIGGQTYFFCSRDCATLFEKQLSA